MKLRIRAGGRCLLASIAGIVLVPIAHADLNLVPGMTPVQAPTAAVIQSICGPLNSPDISRTLDAQQQLLAQNCRKMVQTSNAQQGVGPTTFSLGLSEQGLRDALQAIAAEEMNAQNRTRSTTTGTPINARLLELRRRAGGGALAASTLDINGRTVLLSELFPTDSRGGGASADAGLGGPWSAFVNGYYNWGKRDASALENAFKFDAYGFVAGADYRLSETTVAGLALSYSRTEADFRRRAGDVKSRDVGVSAYASHTRDNMYVDGVIGFTRVKFDTARRIVAVSTTGVEGFDTTAKGSTDADQITASIGTGYDWIRENLTVTPFARLNYLRLKVDGFTERETRHSLGLDIKSRSVTSLQSAIGAQITKAISLESGVVSPYAGIEWNHEFRNKSSSIVAKYAHDPFNTFFVIPTAKPDRNFYTLSAGVTSVYPSGISAFANVDTVVGLRDTRSSSLTIGVRVEF